MSSSCGGGPGVGTVLSSLRPRGGPQSGSGGRRVQLPPVQYDSNGVWTCGCGKSFRKVRNGCNVRAHRRKCDGNGCPDRLRRLRSKVLKSLRVRGLQRGPGVVKVPRPGVLLPQSGLLGGELQVLLHGMIRGVPLRPRCGALRDVHPGDGDGEGRGQFHVSQLTGMLHRDGGEGEGGGGREQRIVCIPVDVGPRSPEGGESGRSGLSFSGPSSCVTPACFAKARFAGG